MLLLNNYTMQHTGAQSAGISTENFKSGSLLETDSYIWNSADALGKGSTAVVYFGRHKDVGDVVAVKVFTEQRHRSAARQREIETIRALKHDNIVRLQALEKEKMSGNEVLIMEYCSGGSLLTVLEQPQYAFGLPEIEFMLFLTHIANGMQYLRSRGYIHRDIKPGNIMRFIAEDGRSVYKLTDFGAARELQDDETFMSIYGTEEYLFPKMYERAVLRQPQPGNQGFDASVDNWSLGVTDYHVCTGQLPFQPHGGRSNAATMHMITSNKPGGIISGVQHVHKGQIVWSSTLPDTCHLSEQLQKMLIEMLAGLMETDPSKMWSFDRYFQAVNHLDNMIVLNIFVCCTAQTINLYVNKTDTYANIKEKIAEETEVTASDQLMLWRDRDLSEVIDQATQVQTYPISVLKGRLYLVNKHSMENSSLKIKTMPSFPEVDGFQNVEKDAQTAKKCTAIAFYICTALDTVLKQQHHTKKGELCYRQYIKIVGRRSEYSVPDMRRTLQETRMRQKAFHSTFDIMADLFVTITALIHSDVVTILDNETLKTIRENIEQLQDSLQDEALDRFYQKIETRLNEIELYAEVLSRKIQEQELDRLKTHIGCSDDDHCLSKAESLRQKISGIAVTMAKHRKYKDLHSHEQFIHQCEKQKLQEHCVALMSLALDHCTHNLKICFKNTLKEMGTLTKHLFRTKKVEQNISSVKECLDQLSSKLGEEEEKCKFIVEKTSKLMSSSLTSGRHVKPGRPGNVLAYRPHKTVALSNLALLSSASCSRNEPADGIKDQPKMLEAIGHHLQTHIAAANSISQGGSYSKSSENEGGSHSKSSRSEGGSHPRSSGNEDVSHPKKQRTLLLDKLTHELLSLEKDSKELKHLVNENAVVMQKFLSETASLHITGSFDSDQSHHNPV